MRPSFLSCLIAAVLGSVIEAAPSTFIDSCQRVPDSSARGHFSFYQWGVDNKSRFKEFCAVPEQYKSVVAAPDRAVGKCKFQNKSMSQSNQDMIVFDILHHKRSGFFIDLAANHWCRLSNTYMLERHYGWKGVCIEASPEYLRGLVSNRTCHVVLNAVSKRDNDIVNFASKGVFGGIVDKGLDNQHVDLNMTDAYVAVTLTTILRALRAPPVIDYLSLDVEGAEHLVLSGLNLNKYIITVLTVERPTREVHNLFTTHKYWFVKVISTFGECLYVHNSYPELNDLMSASFNTASNWLKEHSYLAHPKWRPEAAVIH